MKRICLTESQARAFAAGATELRLPVKPQPWLADNGMWYWGKGNCSLPMNECGLNVRLLVHCPYLVGSLVALTETWTLGDNEDGYESVIYAASQVVHESGLGWRSPATMPAEFSRFKRRVTEVRIEHGTEWEWVLTLEVA